MRKWRLALASAALAAPAVAQVNEVSDGARSHAATMVLVLMVAGAMLTAALMWVLRVTGKLPAEKPMPRPLWVHPDDEDDAG